MSRFRRLLAATVVVAVGTAANAAPNVQASEQRCANDPAAVVGRYQGEVGMRSATDPIETWLTLGEAGRLEGRYVIHEAAGDAPGTLSFQGWVGCNTARFRWRDHYGTGTAEFRFRASDRAFDGNYGSNRVDGGLVWTGIMGEGKTRRTPRPKD